MWNVSQLFYSLQPTGYAPVGLAWRSEESYQPNDRAVALYGTCTKGSTCTKMEIIDACTESLEDCEGEEADNVDDQINIEEEESEL